LQLARRLKMCFVPILCRKCSYIISR
jgi:hypothetical protein